MTEHQKHMTLMATEIFAPLGFTELDAYKILTFDGMEPIPEVDIPAIFYHAGIDAHFAYASEIVDGMYDSQLRVLGAIAVVDDDISGDNFDHFSDIPLELIRVQDLPEFLAQRAFSPEYFDLRVAKQCVAHAKQELNDLEGDERKTRELFRQSRKKWKEAAKHLSNLVVPRFQPVVTI